MALLQSSTGYQSNVLFELRALARDLAHIYRFLGEIERERQRQRQRECLVHNLSSLLKYKSNFFFQGIQKINYIVIVNTALIRACVVCEVVNGYLV